MSTRLIKMTNEKINLVNVYLKNNIPIFLASRLPEEASEFIKKIDKNPTTLHLNTASIKDINGNCYYEASVYKEERIPNTGEIEYVLDKKGREVYIKPIWLQQLEEKCTKNSEGLHILLFDKFLGASPEVMSTIFNMLNDRLVNYLWDLPENARIIFSDVYAIDKFKYENIVTIQLDSTKYTLDWAIENNIHPVLYAYFNSAEKTITESSQLYSPKMLQLISNILYDTNDVNATEPLFHQIDHMEGSYLRYFYDTTLINLEDILNNENSRLNTINSNTPYIALASLYKLSMVDSEYQEKVEEFITNRLGIEWLEVYKELRRHTDNKPSLKLLKDKKIIV